MTIFVIFAFSYEVGSYLLFGDLGHRHWLLAPAVPLYPQIIILYPSASQFFGKIPLLLYKYRILQENGSTLFPSPELWSSIWAINSLVGLVRLPRSPSRVAD